MHRARFSNSSLLFKQINVNGAVKSTLASTNTEYIYAITLMTFICSHLSPSGRKLGWLITFKLYRFAERNGPFRPIFLRSDAPVHHRLLTWCLKKKPWRSRTRYLTLNGRRCIISNYIKSSRTEDSLILIRLSKGKSNKKSWCCSKVELPSTLYTFLILWSRLWNI